jgi:hypothetical protein
LPELTRFFGIIITMYYNDHSPPHFHAKYVDKQASIRINDGHVIDGNLGARALLLVEEWRILPQGRIAR